MAAAAYTTDLATFDLLDAAGAVEPTATGWTSLGTTVTVPDTDDFVQGTGCGSGQCKTGVGGLLSNFGSGITIPTDGAVLFWLKFDAAGGLDTLANGGLRTMIGSGLTAFYWVAQAGSDTYPYGGWVNYAMADPSAITVNTVGSPTATRQYAGCAYNATSVPSKGNPFKMDAIRYGRCEIRMNGGDVGNGYATFAGAATTNDLNTGGTLNRWGLFQAIPGGYQWKGLMVLGYTSAIDFRDSNRSIVVQDTPRVTANFNKIEVRQASSRVDWTNISITSLSTTSRGNFECIDDADVNKDTCVFTDMGTFIYKSVSTILSSTYRRCNLITTGGATFTGCTFDKTNDATKAVTASSPADAALITNSTFISSGTKYGLEITGTAANMTLTNCTWTGYAGSDGSTGNEAVFINIATGSMNLTISGGTVPSIRTAGCVVTVITSSRTVKITVVDADGAAVTGTRVFLAAAAGGPFPYQVTVTSITRSTTTATVTHTGHGLATNDEVLIAGITDKTEDNGVHTITKIDANSYSYTTTNSGSTAYTGTKKVTFVFLKGLANAGTGTNELSMSRSIPSNQPVLGWARKGSGAPLYKTGNIAGTVSSTADSSFSAVMISDA